MFSDFPDGCHCNGYIPPFTVYAKPGEQTVQVTLPEPVLICKNDVKKSVSPPSNSKFKLGQHVITYSYRYRGYKRDLKCFVNFTVAGKWTLIYMKIFLNSNLLEVQIYYKTVPKNAVQSQNTWFCANKSPFNFFVICLTSIFFNSSYSTMEEKGFFWNISNSYMNPKSIPYSLQFEENHVHCFMKSKLNSSFQQSKTNVLLSPCKLTNIT